MKVLGAIIAGGASIRMGQDKAQVLLDGVSLLERTMSRLRIQVDAIVINANGEQGRLLQLEVPTIEDVIAVGTPLSGLHAVLAYGQDKGFGAVVTVPTDAPFLPLDLASRLMAAGAAKGAAIASSAGQSHYLTGVWTTELARPLARLLETGEIRRVQDFVARAEAEIVPWAVEPHDPFFNINTPEDLAKAEAIARGEA
jgi:molybdenum cofactor guanylyltransferase